MHTELQFYTDPYLASVSVNILVKGKDKEGAYFIPDKTIFYYGGGGQPPDDAWLVSDKGEKIPLLKAIPEGQSLKHYPSGEFVEISEGEELIMQIDPQKRSLHSRIHTGGHLVSSVIVEFLKWPLVPFKGYHYPDSPYVEFLNPNNMTEFPQELVGAALEEFVRKDLPIHIRIENEVDFKDTKTFIPPGFQLAPGKPLRLVGIESFLFYPCAGTHTKSTGELRKVDIKYFKSKKGNIRAAYQVPG